MKHLTRKEIQELDCKAIKEYGIPALVLMENAGRAVADEAIKMLQYTKNAAVSILCGQGNNGGDGLVAARHLFNRGIKVKIFYLGDIKNALSKSKSETKINLNIILKMKIPIEEIKQLDLSDLLPHLKHSDLIIDAIFGIGLTRPIEGQLKHLIEAVNQLDAPVIAIDVPSGLDCDNGIPLGISIEATKTVTFGAPKISFDKRSAKKYLGKLIVADINIPRFLFAHQK